MTPPGMMPMGAFPPPGAGAVATDGAVHQYLAMKLSTLLMKIGLTAYFPLLVLAVLTWTVSNTFAQAFFGLAMVALVLAIQHVLVMVWTDL
jgi:hypothetical protein